jgi:hypothetical protein
MAVCLSYPLRAQAVADRSPDNTDVLLIDHDFTARDEFVRVFLQDGQVYRAEIGSPDVTLEIRARIRATQLPRTYVFLPASTPSGTSIVEVYPQADLEYEIRSVSLTGSPVPTRLRLYRDVSASERRQHVRNTRTWETGIELAGGWHSGFALSSAPIGPGSDPNGGTDFEACFTARGAPGRGRLGICALGVGYQSQHGAQSIVWVYTEPRIRLLGPARTGQSSWELGALFRLGLGLISASPVTPAILAPGFYIARQIRSSSSGGGWSMQASYARPFYKFNKPAGGGDAPTRNGHRLTFGIGWYR